MKIMQHTFKVNKIKSKSNPIFYTRKMYINELTSQ